MKGFFSSQEWQKQRTPLPTVPLCGTCGIHAGCRSPKMPVDGKGRRKVLIVGEAPGAGEDERGRPFVGAAGVKLAGLLHQAGVDMRKDCWLTNALICRPTDKAGRNRTPTDKEVGYCQPNLSKTLASLRPDVVIPVGRVATRTVVDLAWRPGKVKEITPWVGWRIPSVALNAWVCPTYHPSFLLREDGGGGGPSRQAAELHTLKHLAGAFSLVGRPWGSKPDWSSCCDVVLDDALAAKAVRAFMSLGVPLAFDYETTCLKPDGRHARILCCSVSDGKASIAFPWRGEARLAVRDLVLSGVPKIGANIKFEERWTWKEFGHGVNNWYRDTVLGAHWLDCRRGVCSLKFQAFVLLGVPDYSSHLDKYMEAEGENSPNRLSEVDPVLLMRYCAMDSLLEVLVSERQWGEGE